MMHVCTSGAREQIPSHKSEPDEQPKPSSHQPAPRQPDCPLPVPFGNCRRIQPQRPVWLLTGRGRRRLRHWTARLTISGLPRSDKNGFEFLRLSRIAAGRQY